MKRVWLTILSALLIPGVLWATPSRETDRIDAVPYVLYGKTSGGVIKPLLVDTDGTVQTGGSGAPTDADYLVGTANGSLSAEIVVGTTPGGELGGTWGSPTIDDNVTVTGWEMGASTATTPSADDNDTSLATTAFVQTELTGDIAQAENSSLILDAALSADGKYSGITETGTAGAALAFGDLVYLAVADSRWELADASAASTSGMKLGICVLAATGDGEATKILLWGKVRADTAFPALTIGAAAYVSETAGDIVTAQPTTTDAVIRVVGFANTADELYFCPSPDYVTHV